jgi:hypothetical protein
LTLSNSDRIHTNNNLINSNLIYKFYTTTIKPLKVRLNKFIKNHKTTTTTVKHQQTTPKTTTLNDSDLIIIQPDIEYAELLSLLQQQNQAVVTTTDKSSLFAYFQLNSSNLMFKINSSLIIQLIISCLYSIK